MGPEDKGYGRTIDGLMLLKNGGVIEFDPAVIQQAINNIPKRGFYENHCLDKYGGDCSKCPLPACPIADQG